ncbi:pentatricopeptide repeat-containing protein At2g21090 [Magnolia sinica]|uniref:pentatricopeptide repeat-containing protein At2g21090 n=1 Tax=Magnolia sinica TaxID=86752 RepID=UPI00265A4F82|nr:pentatricopeptide repeat-containing protein At2g21090 [Magnolia sinica]
MRAYMYDEIRNLLPFAMPSLSSSNFIQIPPKQANRSCLVQSIFALCSQNNFKKAIDSLSLLSSRGIRLDTSTLAFLLHQFGTTKSLALAKSVHLHLKLTGRKRPKIFLSNHLIHLYFNCGSHSDARNVFDKMSVRNIFSWNAMLAGYTKLGMLKPARRVFDQMPERDVVSWNTMIIGLARNSSGEEAVGFYMQLRRSSVGSNQFSFAGVLIACVRLEELGLTRQVHGQVLVVGFLSNLVISSSIVDVYAKCGCVDDSRRLFDEMPVRDVLAWTTLVSGYAKCGDLKSAHRLFDDMPVKNAVSWTALIGGYVRNGLEPEALELFKKMVMEGVKPDQYTFSSCLCACASMASLKHGKQTHAHLIRIGFNPNAIVVSTLVDMYSKCGCLEESRRVFNCMAKKEDSVSWNTMIAALAQHGYGEEAIKLFREMVRAGTKPDQITFVVVLTACSHSGLVQEGIQIFECMRRDHGIVPGQEHYACLVDLLGRAGRFVEAIEWIEKMSCEPDARVWNALLGACRIHGNIELGTRAAEHLLELEPQSPAAYVLLSNMYAAVGRWGSVEKVRHLMNERQVRKERAISWIEVDGNVHAFTVSDRLHPLTDAIFAVLEQLAGHMEDVPFIM